MDNLDERIAELQQRIAEKKAFQRMYPSHKYASTWDYVAEGDRSGFDRMDASEAAYHNMLLQHKQQNAILQAQQDFNAEQNELNRQNALNISKAQKDEQSKYMQNEIANKYQLALTDYELASQQVDMQKPETLARLKRAAQLVNHYGTQLNFDNVSGEATEDSPSIKVNKAIAKVIALKKITPKKWTDAQKQEYVDTMALIPDDDERKAELEVALTNMPKTTNEKEYDRFLQLKKAVDAGYSLFGKDLVDWNNLSKKYK